MLSLWCLLDVMDSLAMIIGGNRMLFLQVVITESGIGLWDTDLDVLQCVSNCGPKRKNRKKIQDEMKQ